MDNGLLKKASQRSIQVCKDMKANELMAGDWVNVFGTPKQIEGVRKFRNGDEIVYYDGDNGNFIKAVTPIPLTKEILEKNGFEIVSATQTPQMKELQIPPCIRYGIQLGEYSGIYISFGLQDCPLYDIRSDYRVSQGACEYVHELQHALKLCEIEKEIIL